MKYNFIRPIMLIAIAFLVKNLVTSICLMFGMGPESAESVGFMAMIIAALIVYTRIAKKRKR
ncbi:hypothetical protein ACX1C1_08835 [Paenibacillus sp. strain BS8-2]